MFQNISSFSRYFEQQMHQYLHPNSCASSGSRHKSAPKHRTRSEDPSLYRKIVITVIKPQKKTPSPPPPPTKEDEVRPRKLPDVCSNHSSRRLSEPEIQNILSSIRRKSDSHERMSKPSSHWRYSRPPPNEVPPPLPPQEHEYHRMGPFGPSAPDSSGDSSWGSRSSRSRHRRSMGQPSEDSSYSCDSGGGSSRTTDQLSSPRKGEKVPNSHRNSTTEEEIANILKSHRDRRQRSCSSFRPVKIPVHK